MSALLCVAADKLLPLDRAGAEALDAGTTFPVAACVEVVGWFAPPNVVGFVAPTAVADDVAPTAVALTDVATLGVALTELALADVAPGVAPTDVAFADVVGAPDGFDARGSATRAGAVVS
ncbi:MAG: hypothetical protein ACM3ZE_19185 [Myxococcales bacterium]